MPLSTTIILGAIVAMFSIFILVVGVVSTWLNISEARENALARRNKPAGSAAV